MNAWILWLWLVPAVTMTVWTLFVAVKLWRTPYGARVKPIVGWHCMKLMFNPKDDRSYVSPPGMTVLTFLAMSILPFVSLMFFIFSFTIVVLLLYCSAEERGKRFFFF